MEELTIAKTDSREILYSWPSNGRELKHVFGRAILLEDCQVLQGEDFTPEKGPLLSNKTCHNTHRSAAYETDTNLILKAPEVSGGNKSQAARLLSLSRRTIHAKLKK